MRYADPFRDAGRPETTDHDFLLTCSCGTEQRLDEMTLDESGVDHAVRLQALHAAASSAC